MKESKVLLISHNVLDNRNNMGKTLSGFFPEWSSHKLAQLYFHPEDPTTDSCNRYYRITDIDALRSIGFGNHRNVGRIFSQDDVDITRTSSRVDTGIRRKMYFFGQKRTPLIYAARNTMWRLSNWYSDSLKKWISDFSPDVVFFAAGDYSFSYKIAYVISRDFDIPIVIYCCDDYYIHNRNADSLLGRLQHKLFLKTVYKTMTRTKRVFTICESLKAEYEILFEKDCYVLHTAASDVTQSANRNCAGGISYLGNLSLGRADQLAAMGRVMKKYNGWIDVYSQDWNPEYIKQLTEENGIHFRGAVSAEEVLAIMRSCKAIIHTESFAPKFQAITRFSVSTKIADSLMNGPCVIAYGPKGIASIDYLEENRAAYVISDPADLENGLQEILSDAALREEIMGNARTLAEKNHHPKINPVNMRKWLEEVCEVWENRQ